MHLGRVSTSWWRNKDTAKMKTGSIQKFQELARLGFSQRIVRRENECLNYVNKKTSIQQTYQINSSNPIQHLNSY